MTQVMEGPVTAPYQAPRVASSRRGSTNCRLQTHHAMHESAKYKCVRSERRDPQNKRKNAAIASNVTLQATGMTNCKKSRTAKRGPKTLAGPTRICASECPTHGSNT